MTKYKHMKKISFITIIFSAVFFSPHILLANTTSTIVRRINSAPVINDDSYQFIRPIPAGSGSNSAMRPIIIEDDIIPHDDENRLIDYIKIDSIPELIIEEINDTPELTNDFLVDYIKLDDIPSLIGESEVVQTPSPIERPPLPQSTEVELTHWEDVKTFLSVGDIIPIYDILSGITYNVHVLSNGAHADVETVTARDTEIKLEILDGEWDWTPRPVWVTIGDRVVAASINGFPHDIYTIPDNNMDGHVCLHFYGSTTHNNNLEFARLHQDILIKAWNMSFEDGDRGRSFENWNQIRSGTTFTANHKN